MKCLLQIELKKAFSNKLFWITLLLGLVIVSISAYQNINGYFEFANDMQMRQESDPETVFNPINQVFTLYNSWIGAEVFMPMNSLYYLLLPLLASLAYGWSYFTEKKSGYVKNVVTRIDKKKYYLAKYIAVFLAGGAVVAIPLLVNVLTVACVVPAYQPDIYYQIYYNMYQHYLAWMFYSMPALYVIYVMVLDFVFAGLIAVLSLALTFFVNNRFAVVLLPMLFFMWVQYMEELVRSTFPDMAPFSPQYFLKAYGDSVLLWVVVWGIGLLVVTLGIVYGKGVKDDVF